MPKVPLSVFWARPTDEKILKMEKRFKQALGILMFFHLVSSLCG